MNDKYKLMFLEEDDGGGGGGGEDVARGTAVFDEPAARESAPSESREPSEPGRTQAVPYGAPTVDARQLATEFGHVLGQQFKPPPKEITVEEAKKLLNVWEPSPEWVAKYDNIETRNQALAEQRDGMIRQADTITQYRLREMQQAMEQRYAPVVEYMQQNEARAGEYRFANTYPELNAPALRPVLFNVAQSLLRQGVRFRSEAEMFEMVARGVEAVVKVNNPQFQLTRAGSGGRPVQQGASRQTSGGIPVTTPGGGGGGGERQPVAKKPRGLAIWD